MLKPPSYYRSVIMLLSGLIYISVPPAHARSEMQTFFGPEIYIRGTGKPKVETVRHFTGGNSMGSLGTA